MDESLFQELLESTKEAGAISRGEWWIHERMKSMRNVFRGLGYSDKDAEVLKVKSDLMDAIELENDAIEEYSIEDLVKEAVELGYHTKVEVDDDGH